MQNESLLSFACKSWLRYSRERAPTSLQYDEGSRALIWDCFLHLTHTQLIPCKADSRPVQPAAQLPVLQLLAACEIDLETSIFISSTPSFFLMSSSFFCKEVYLSIWLEPSGSTRRAMRKQPRKGDLIFAFSPGWTDGVPHYLRCLYP